jgi:glycosyltransferase involved in cell wall biosynthesis
MKIIHVEDFIQPDAGYQVNVLSKLQVDQGHEVHIVTSSLDRSPSYLSSFFGTENIDQRDINFHTRTGVRIHRLNVLACLSSRAVYFPNVFKVVDELEPDVVYVHGEDTLIGIQFIIRSLWQKYPLVLDCHMLEMASVNRFKHLFRLIFRLFITPIIIRNNIPLIRTVDTDYVQKCLGLPLYKTDLLSFGSDIDMFSPNRIQRDRFFKEYSLDPSDFIVMYAGKFDEQKGGAFLANALREKFHLENGKSLIFLIIGSTVGDYGKVVEEIFSSSENKIIRVPTVPYYELAKYYQAADLAVFPKQCSLSFFDVQSTGIPVLMELNEINEKRSKNGACILFNPLDINDFRSNIIVFANKDEFEMTIMKERARKSVISGFNYVEVAKKYTDVLLRAVTNFRKKESPSS